MDLQSKLQDDMRAALKAGQKDRLQVIRMLLSDVKTVDLMPGKPTPQQAVEAYAEMDFEAVINAMGAFNESMITAGVLGLFWHYGNDLPDYHQLAHYEPPVTTRTGLPQVWPSMQKNVDRLTPPLGARRSPTSARARNRAAAQGRRIPPCRRSCA